LNKTFHSQPRLIKIKKTLLALHKNLFTTQEQDGSGRSLQGQLFSFLSETYNNWSPTYR